MLIDSLFSAMNNDILVYEMYSINFHCYRNTTLDLLPEPLFERGLPLSILSHFPCILPVWDPGSPTGVALQCATQLEGRVLPSGLLTTVRWSIVSPALQ